MKLAAWTEEEMQCAPIRRGGFLNGIQEVRGSTPLGSTNSLIALTDKLTRHFSKAQSAGEPICACPGATLDVERRRGSAARRLRSKTETPRSWHCRPPAWRAACNRICRSA